MVKLEPLDKDEKNQVAEDDQHEDQLGNELKVDVQRLLEVPEIRNNIKMIKFCHFFSIQQKLRNGRIYLAEMAGGKSQ